MERPSLTHLLVSVFLVAAGCIGQVRLKTDFAKLPGSSFRTLQHHRNGQVREVELTQDVAVEDLFLPSGTRIQFDEVYADVAYVVAKQSIVVHGIDVPPSSIVGFAVPAGGDHHTLTNIELGADTSYQSIDFRAGSIVGFNGERTLDKVTLNGSHVLGEKRYQHGDTVWFNEVGEVVRVVTLDEGREKEQREDACRSRCAPDGNDVNRWKACMSACR